MRAGPFPFFVLGVTLMALLPVVLFVSTSAASSLYCPRDGAPNSYVLAPARQTTEAHEPPVEEGPFSYSWVTIWSNSTATYALFLLNGSQWEVYQPNSTPASEPPVGTSFSAPPTGYFWNSGQVTSTNTTLHYPPAYLDWWLLVDNPGSVGIEVNSVYAVCGQPS